MKTQKPTLRKLKIYLYKTRSREKAQKFPAFVIVGDEEEIFEEFKALGHSINFDNKEFVKVATAIFEKCRFCFATIE